MIEVEKTMQHSKHLISPYLFGEAVLTIGSALREIIDNSCGVISIGPFGCMPARVAESILSKEMNKTGKEIASKKEIGFETIELPFLALETDGNIFPPLIQSKIEIFMLQANRLHEKMMEIEK